MIDLMMRSADFQRRSIYESKLFKLIIVHDMFFKEGFPMPLLIIRAIVWTTYIADFFLRNSGLGLP
jgi:hypothetical protein